MSSRLSPGRVGCDEWWPSRGPTWRRNAPFSCAGGAAMRERVRRGLAAAIGGARRAMGSEAGRKARLRGVVFDMDGTLTVPVIDFGAMYREVLGEDEYSAMRARDPHGYIDILHHVETLPPPARKRAHEIIADFERQGLERLQIMPGAAELCGYLDSKQVRRGLITRNVKHSVDMFHVRFGMEFSPALSREFRPYKPHPAPLLHICSQWDAHPTEVMMIGDSLRDDVGCGKGAGTFTCLLDESGKYGVHEHLGVDLRPDFKVSSLHEVVSILETHFQLSATNEIPLEKVGIASS
ncbi:haloacid dehalogenase-like hydrolase (HAD) superfamily protein [Wolffia australiana]